MPDELPDRDDTGHNGAGRDNDAGRDDADRDDTDRDDTGRDAQLTGRWPAAGGEPVRQFAEASRVLEQVARRRGLLAHRLDDSLLWCEQGQCRMLFHGFTGPSSGRAWHVLCGEPAWLRQRLAAAGLPVVPTRLVDLTDAGYAQQQAEGLGYPVRLRSGPAEQRADAAAGFAAAWQALAAVTAPRDGLTIEQVVTGDRLDLAVVGEQVVAASAGELPETAGPLAVRTLAALPGLPYASVGLIAAGAGLLVDRVDGTLSSWAGSTEVASAVLDHEFRA
jgi:hypothetical protein